jgi:hypothetical protein
MDRQKEGTEDQDMDEAETDVGYGRPPKHAQFKPGQCGNPKGRPRGSISFKAMLRKIFKEKVTFREGNRIKKISKLEAIQRALVHKAMKGDPKAYKIFDEMLKDDPAVLESPPLLTFIFSDEVDKQEP